MVHNREKGLECEVCLEEMRYEHMSEFKYLGCVFGESATDEVECGRKVASGKRVACGIRCS